MELDPLALKASLKEKALNNTITEEEMRQWIELVRAGRSSAATISAKSRAKKAPISVDSMLDELDQL